MYFNAEGQGTDIQLATLNGSSTGGDFRLSDGQVFTTKINSAQLEAKLDKSGISAHANLKFADKNFINAEVTLPKATTTNLLSKNQGLQGKLSLVIDNLAPIQAFIPKTVNPQGRLSANLLISGTLGEPLVNGNANIAGGELKIPGLNILLNQINLAVNAKGTELNYILTATSQNQPLRAVGKTFLKAGFPTELTLTGNTVLLANTPTYNVFVSPNVHLKIVGKEIDISGSVDIPKAMLRKLEFESETTLPEGEVIFIGEQPVEKVTPLNLKMELTINLGKDVRVDTTNLKGKLGGSLTLIVSRVRRCSDWEESILTKAAWKFMDVNSPSLLVRVLFIAEIH